MEATTESTIIDSPAPQVLRIFRELFENGAIGLDDSFIELGGDSLLATRLVSRCTEAFHVPLSADLLFRYQTARLLGEAILAHRQPGRKDLADNLIPLGGARTGRPVFFVPPLYGNSWVFQPLFEHVTWTRPAYGCRPPELDDGRALDIGEMVEYYVAVIRAAQPRGPYSIVGYSFGASVAFEVACRLAAVGEDVRHLVLLDGELPAGHSRWTSIVKRSFFAALRTLFERGLIGRGALRALGFRTLGSQVTLSFGSGPLTARELQMVLRLAAPRALPARDLRALSLAELCAIVARHVKATTDPAVWERLMKEAGSEDPVAMVKAHKVALKNVWLARSYRPHSIFPGTITHYASTQNHSIAGWQAFSTRPMDVRRVDIPVEGQYGQHGAHSQFLRGPYVGLYAEGFRGLLDA